VCVCVRACERACVRACVRASVLVCVCRYKVNVFAHPLGFVDCVMVECSDVSEYRGVSVFRVTEQGSGRC
jgi:hypothetical protein